MMKKWFCGLLSLAVLAPATCFAETLAADNGLTITLPEGITAQAVEGDSGSSFDYQWVLSDENGDGSVSFNYQTMAVSGLEGLNFQDLTEDQLTTLKDAVAQALPDAVEQTAPAQDHLQYTLEAETGTQTHFITLVNGTMVDVYATSSEALSQEDQTLCLDLMNSVTVEGDTTTDGTTSA